MLEATTWRSLDLPWQWSTPWLRFPAPQRCRSFLNPSPGKRFHPLAASGELTGLKGEEDWVLPSVTDLKRLQWVATQSFDIVFSPCTLLLDQYPLMHPLEALERQAAGKCCLVSVSST